MKRFFSVRAPVPLLAALTLLLLWDATGFAKLSLLCAALHECGHILAFCALTGHFPRITCSFSGLAMEMDGVRLSLQKENLLLLAGPAANLLAALAAYLLIQHRASYLRYFFACENLCMALFNLLPIGFLDGGRLLSNCFGLMDGVLFRALTLCCCCFLAVFGGVLLRYCGAGFLLSLGFCLMVLALCAKSLRS